MPTDNNVQFDKKISILFLAADPSNATRLRLGEEFREIQEKLKLAKLRDHFRLELPQLSVRATDVSQALLDVQPQIVHFSGHGTSTGALCFENQEGKTHLIQPDTLAALFEQFSRQVSCVVLNACYSEMQANAIAKHIDFVIGMNQAVCDKTAITFAIGFYQALGAGCSVEDSYKLGCVQIRLQGISEYLTPVIVKKEQATYPLMNKNFRFAKLEKFMPDLLVEMRNDLADHPLRREFVLLKKAWTYNSRGNELIYYYDDHSELDSKVRILENEGLIRAITYKNVARYTITEELADYLSAQRCKPMDEFGTWH